MTRTKLQLPDKFDFSTEVQVEVSDINYAGHLGNDKVLSFVHEARVRFLKQFDFTELNIDGAGTIMIDAVILYKSEAFYGDTLKIEVATGNFHRIGCDFFFRITNAGNGREVARAKTGMVFFDYEKKKILPLPDRFNESCHPK